MTATPATSMSLHESLGCAGEPGFNSDDSAAVGGGGSVGDGSSNAYPTKEMLRARPRRSCLRRQITDLTVEASSAELSSTNLLGVTTDNNNGECHGELRRGVSFADKLNVREYGMILGDHPSVVDNGPPLTIDWEVQDAYNLQVPDRVKTRKAFMLRIPASLRTEVVAQNYTQAEISKATFEVRKYKSQRHSSITMQEFEGVQVAWQSAMRKLRRWRQKRNPSAYPHEPAKEWLEQNTTRRGSKLVLKPGVAPYDPRTAIPLCVESPSKSSSREESDMLDGANVPLTNSSQIAESSPNDIPSALRTDGPDGISTIPPPVWISHQRKVSDGSDDTAPSTVYDDDDEEEQEEEDQNVKSTSKSTPTSELTTPDFVEEEGCC